MVISVVSITSCTNNKTSKILTIHNSTDFNVTYLAIAPSENVLGDENVIIFTDIEAKNAFDITVAMPQKANLFNWYAVVGGTVTFVDESFTQITETIITEIPLGSVFSSERSGGAAYGFTIGFDEKVIDYTLTPLDNDDI